MSMKEIIPSALPQAVAAETGTSQELVRPELVKGQQLNWSVSEDGMLTLFEGNCYESENGNWAVPWLGGILAEVDPAPISGEILEIIEVGKASGKEDKIAYVGLNPLAAMQLYLEGVLTKEALEASLEVQDESISTEVTLGDVQRPVVVSPLFEEGVATYDETGQIVH